MDSIGDKNVKERPILFSAPMVRAILEGRKTQTRRVAMFKQSDTPLPYERGTSTEEYRDGFVVQGRIGACWNDLTKPLKCPYGQPGDRLWVRETWYKPDFEAECGVKCFYRADAYDDGVHVPYLVPGDGIGGGVGEARIEKWKPSIYMPRWASRILLEIVSVRVERLKDISRDDCIAEGCPPPDGACTMQDEYYCLWEKINGKGSCDANPWVWVIEFRRVNKES